LPENRYAPPVCILARKKAIFGQPNADTICTSYVERQNLNIRLFNRRFTRLTLGYSKKLANLRYSAALFACYWNFCWKHTATKKTPAQAIGLTDHHWEIAELLNEIGTI
jgi:hypothetical protein